MPEVTADERAKRVVDGDGNDIGFVADVEDGTAYVDPKQEARNEVMMKLGWTAEDRTTFPLRHDAIDEITDEAIRLRPDYAGE